MSGTLLFATPSPPAPGAVPARRSGVSRAAPAGGGLRSPSAPPLLDGESSATDQEAEAPEAQADPLVGNGLGSPDCRDSGVLDALDRRNCETSGFVAAPDPTANYGIDVHIDTGLFGVSAGGLLSIVQDLFITPVWTGLVWLVHALFVMVEWSFSIDLFEGGSANAVQAGLARALDAITGPWLTLSLAIAAVLVAYRGLVQRRVADALGEALLMFVMFVAGVLVVVDPQGTVGMLTRWSDQAALGTLAVAAQGSPSDAGRALGSNLSGVFAAVIEAPWCYLEFGAVSWCREPGQLDPALRSAGLRIAARERTDADCAGARSSCGSSQATSARLLEEARTNGELFLALPANGPARNSINQEGSLLRTLCGTAEATNCRGPGAAEAQFRTNSGTWPRVAGLLLIASGLLGMALLVGHIIVRLLGAALLSVFYLLLAPVIVLAPALGEWGRGLFRSWAGHLLGAIASKLLFAFLLGVVLAMMAMLESLGGLGWWTQWLLMSAFWWGLWVRRHRLLAVTSAPAGATRPRHSIPRRAADALALRRSTRAVAQRLHGAAQAPATPSPRGLPPASRDLSRSGEDGQAQRLARFEARPESAARLRSRLLAGEAQLARLDAARRAAQAERSDRRMVRLEVRARRVRAQVEADRGTLARAQHDARSPAARLSRWSGFLDAQSALPSAALARRGGSARDYPALSGLLGLRVEQYRALPAGAQRAARLRIDRELALRRASRGHSDVARRASADVRPPPRQSPPAAVPEPAVMRDAREVAAGRKRQLGIGKP